MSVQLQRNEIQTCWFYYNQTPLDMKAKNCSETIDQYLYTLANVETLTLLLFLTMNENIVVYPNELCNILWKSKNIHIPDTSTTYIIA